MSLLDLIRRNVLHYWRTNLAVIAGVAVAVIAAGVFGVFRLNRTIVQLEITLRMVEKELADHDERIKHLERETI